MICEVKLLNLSMESGSFEKVNLMSVSSEAKRILLFNKTVSLQGFFFILLSDIYYNLSPSVAKTSTFYWMYIDGAQFPFSTPLLHSSHTILDKICCPI